MRTVPHASPARTIASTPTAWSTRDMEASDRAVSYTALVANRIDLLVADAYDENMDRLAVVLAQFSGLVRAMNAGRAPLAGVEPSDALNC